jgi:hypothetical protein
MLLNELRIINTPNGRVKAAWGSATEKYVLYKYSFIKVKNRGTIIVIPGIASKDKTKKKMIFLNEKFILEKQKPDNAEIEHVNTMAMNAIIKEFNVACIKETPPMSIVSTRI